MDGNFKCNTCGREFFESMYTMTYLPGGALVYRNKFKKRIQCPECKGEDIVAIPKEGSGVPYFTKFNALSNDEKRSLLKKRADMNALKNQDERRSINERFNKKIKGGL